MTTTEKTKVNEHGLDLELVIKEFQACHPEKDVVMLDHYNVAFSEIARFFEVLGPLFGFVASDVRDKVGILEKHKKTRFGEHFETVQSIVTYEIRENLTKKKSEGLLSGSRTILRLHRALEFITELLRKVEYSDDSSAVSTLAGEAYNGSLAKFHPWLIRKAAGLAMYSLPSRKKFMATSFQQSAEEAERILPQFLEIAKCIHDEIQQLYAQHDILMLP
ncbi:ceramide-1-phosphate transfer protein-like [Glandiceps talaboti]